MADAEKLRERVAFALADITEGMYAAAARKLRLAADEAASLAWANRLEAPPAVGVDPAKPGAEQSIRVEQGPDGRREFEFEGRRWGLSVDDHDAPAGAGHEVEADRG